jgi:hypothetical protein
MYLSARAGLGDCPSWPTKAMAHKAIFEYIEGWYNIRLRSDPPHWTTRVTLGGCGMTALSYANPDGKPVVSSLTGGPKNLSLFRYRD